MLRFATLGSGSAGNATLFMQGDEALLIDCGLSVRQLEARLATLGCEPAAIGALLLTHEHDDHIASAGAFSRKHRVPIYLSSGTRLVGAAALGGAHEQIEFLPDIPFCVGAFDIAPVIVPHDAREPCQFVIGDGNHRVGVLTDVGQITPHLVRHFTGLDAFMLEFNHDPSLLAASHYPAGLKSRIAGDYGHLSNTQAETLLKRVAGSRLQHVVAAHLSEKTNTPACVQQCLTRVLAPEVSWTIASQHQVSPWYEVG